MTKVHLTMVSGNRKTGPIPVTTTEPRSCPAECPLAGPSGSGQAKGGACYAAFGPLGMHWRAVGGKRGGPWTLFCRAIARFPRRQVWRHNQAGDLPKDDAKAASVDQIDADKALELAQAAKHTRGWTYTHYDPTDSHNANVIRSMNKKGGLTVNLSADTLAQADDYAALGIGPVVVTLPADAPRRGNRTPGGLPVVVCPAQTADVSCARCQLCQRGQRNSVVGFLAHGPGKKRVE